MKSKPLFQLLVLLTLLFSPFGANQPVRADAGAVDKPGSQTIDRNFTALQAPPIVSMVVSPSSVPVGEIATVTVSLNHVPAEGYTSAELTCTYDSDVVEASNIVIGNLFGIDPVTAINGPHNGSFIVAIAGSDGKKVMSSGVVLAFNVRGLQAGQSSLECQARVSTGNNALTTISSTGTKIIVLENILTPTVGPALCDKVQLVADVTVPDGNPFPPGATFTKTWRLKNVGSCTWTASYQLVFFSGEQMGAPSSINFSQNVAPGQVVNISVNLTAPVSPGSYRGYWMFKNANGALFGIGPQANRAWWVEIRVVGATITPTVSQTQSPASSTPTSTTAAQRITFDPGQTTASRIGIINPNEMIQYVLSAAQSQVLSIKLIAPANEVAIGVNGPTGLPLKPLDPTPTWSTTITTAGDHTINIANVLGNSSKSYTLEVSLTSAATPATPTPSIIAGGPTAPPSPNVVYDFAANACSATWFSGAGQLPCPGVDGNPNGFVLRLSNPRLETGVTDIRPGLLTFPQNVQNGYIQGFYPPFHVQNGDHFRATIGCEGSAVSCYVAFRLDYLIDTDPIRTFWGPFLERYEGQYFLADVDLSPLAGKDVKFILTVLAAGSASGDRALWASPAIYRLSPTSTLTPPATPEMDWLTFTNTRYGFELKYPPPGPAVANNNTFAHISLPFVQGTTLQDKSLYISALENISPCMGGLPLPQSSQNVTINGITFLKQTGQDSGAGHLFRWTSYATPGNNVCVSLTFMLDSINPGLPDTPQYDEAIESAIFEQIVATYRWLEITPTITPQEPPINTPTPTGTFIPTTGTITGQVVAGKPVILDLFDADNNPVAVTFANADGTFSLTAPAGTYNLVAHAPGFLSAMGPVTITAGGVTSKPTITLLPGDIDSNFMIDWLDAVTIGMSYNTSYPPAADLNNDGIINVLDLELLAHNYRKTGPVVWE